MHSHLPTVERPTANTTPSHPMQQVRPAGLALPRRVDVHRVDALVAALRAAAPGASGVEVDGSGVEMIDHAGLAALEQFAAVSPLVVVSPSVALAKTAEYTGHRRISAACAVDTSLRAAA